MSRVLVNQIQAVGTLGDKVARPDLTNCPQEGDTAGGQPCLQHGWLMLGLGPVPSQGAPVGLDHPRSFALGQPAPTRPQAERRGGRLPQESRTDNALDNSEDQIRLTESDLGFRRVHIDIDHLGRYGQEQHDNRMPTDHQEAAISLTDGGRQARLLDPAPVDEERHLAPIGAADGWLADIALDPKRCVVAQWQRDHLARAVHSQDGGQYLAAISSPG